MAYELLAQQEVRAQMAYRIPDGGPLSQYHDKDLLLLALILSQQEHWLFP